MLLNTLQKEVHVDQDYIQTVRILKIKKFNNYFLIILYSLQFWNDMLFFNPETGTI